MHTNTRTAARKFDTALRELERAASIPTVPGELVGWCNNVVAALDHLAELWPAYLDRETAVFGMIRKQDPGLAHRTDTLRDDDAQLGRNLERLRAQTGALAALSDSDTGSWEPRLRGKALRDDVLGLVVAIRAQRARVDNWFVESHYRDRGVAD